MQDLREEYHSNRLKLTRFSDTDAAFMLELVNTDGWLRFIGDRNVRTEEDAVAYIKKTTDNPNAQGWVVRISVTGVPAGVVTFLQRDYLDHPDIGFAFLPAFGGQGYAEEAALTLLHAIIHETTYEKLMATTLPDNTRSIRLLEKLGLQFERTIEVNNEALQVYARDLRRD
jgi:[ribosomal protein S5]-alanine N-acetyltransferase